MNRPPPLQLVLDNMLPNLGMQPQRSFFMRIYEINWRPVVITLTTINALRFALLASNSFHDEAVDLDEHFPNLARISFTLGVMYLLACLMESFGLFSSLFPGPCVVRFYTLFSFLSLVVATSARTIAAVGYFAFADDLVAECVKLASTGSMDTRSLFRSDAWHRRYNVPVPQGQAQFQCLSTWNSESASEILSVIFFSFVPSMISFLVAWTWSRQIRDPGHVAFLGNSRLCCGAQRSSLDGTMEERSPLYRGSTPQIHTAHSHHITTQQQHQRGRRPPPLPLALALPRQNEHFQTMEPLALESSATPYGVTPGPPSYAHHQADYSYAYEVEIQPQQQPMQQVRRGRGEYWFV